ncbi:MAG: DNA primase [Candidatus Aenigmarchaeota archaeon]|nr:DNA primase [Candidatus Aenigmarchaeota archaeon]
MIIMSKLAPTSIKYVIKAQIDAKGVIEKPDVIGAIFGQTEGLLGSDLDLRELQRTGRIGRIEVNVKSDRGNSSGELIIPSSLDSAETALIAATLETIERVGPCTARITLKSVEDTRALKRKQVLEKAKMILKELLDKGIPDTTKITEEIKEEIKTYEVTTYQNLPCGPGIMDSDEIIVVEGRADVINLIKYGIRNVIAFEGSSVPPAIVNLMKEKITTVFVDGDRGGELNLKGLLEAAEVDYVIQAPNGKEVEELSKKEVYKSLRNKISVSQFKMENPAMFKKTSTTTTTRRTTTRSSTSTTTSAPQAKIETKTLPNKSETIDEKQMSVFKKTLEELIGTRAACIFDSDFNLLGKVPVKELENVLKTVDKPFAVVFDGKIDYNLDFIAKKKGIKFLVGMEKENMRSSITLLSRENLK